MATLPATTVSTSVRSGRKVWTGCRGPERLLVGETPDGRRRERFAERADLDLRLGRDVGERGEAGEPEEDLLLPAPGEMPEGGAGMWCSRIAVTSTSATARHSGGASAANVLSSGSATTA